MSIGNILYAEAITALVPALKMLTGLQSLDLSGECVGVRRLRIRVTRGCLILSKVEVFVCVCWREGDVI